MHPFQDKMSALREKWQRRLEHDGRREFIEICRKIVSIENLTTLEYDKFDSVMQQRYVDRPDFSGYDARPQSPPATTGAMPPPNIVKPKGATASSWDDDSGRFLVIRHRFQEYCVKFFCLCSGAFVPANDGHFLQSKLLAERQFIVEIQHI